MGLYSDTCFDASEDSQQWSVKNTAGKCKRVNLSASQEGSFMTNNKDGLRAECQRQVPYSKKKTYQGRRASVFVS